LEVLLRIEWKWGTGSYRYARYVVADAELALAPDARPAGEGAAQ
jgi:hypothetical protein